MHGTSTDTPQQPVPVRYDYLDALRGLAILGVVMVHSQNTVTGSFWGGRMAFAGRYGVQLFFMVSAYTIFLSLDRARWDGWRTWAEFYIRRVFRILPMFWVGLALYAFVPGRGPMYVNQTYTPLDYALTAVLQHGWHPALINSLVPGGWSIAAEGTFYLLVPFCFWLVKSWPSALWFLVGTILLAALTEPVLDYVYTRHILFAAAPPAMIGEFGYCQFLVQWPIFACGMLTYRMARSQDRQPWSPSAGAALLVAISLWLPSVVDIGRCGFLPERLFFSFGFIALILGLKACPTRLLVNPVTCYLGKVSYSIYLLHFVVLRLAVNSLDTYLDPSQQGLTRFLLVFASTAAGAAALSFLTYRCIERPCIDLGARLIRHRRAAHASAPAAWMLPEVSPAPAGQRN